MEGLKITENAVLNGPRTAWIKKKRLLELDGKENVVVSWMIEKTSP